MTVSADQEYISDLDEEWSTAEVYFGHFLDGDATYHARDDGRFMDMISAAALPLVVNAVLRG